MTRKAYFMNRQFDLLCDLISGVDVNGDRYGECDVNGVSAWYFKEDYCKFNGYQRDDDGVEFTVNGVTYYEHWFFVNEQHDSTVVGYSIMSENGDVQFCVVGNKIDQVCDFQTMYKYLTDKQYFVE